ncbi:MAG: glycerol kinase GlpK [Pseudomonadota bacterium]
MPPPALIAIDQGTTSSRAMAFDLSGESVASAQAEFPQIYPADGWVEHDPEAIWTSVVKTARAAIGEAEAKGYAPAAIGVANQRETVVIWDRKTGAPIYNAIVWQDRRTADMCAQLVADGADSDIQARTGLIVDPYFSATKIAWILDKVSGARARAEAGDLAFGTIDTFLIWRLTGGRVHATDGTNASRTSLFNLETLDWDDALLQLFKIPRAILPEIKDCAADFGTTNADILGQALAITGIAGDQQAAAIGQACFSPGDIKSTYGTGCFALINTGDMIARSQNRLLSTLAYRLDGRPSYALEGSLFIAGAAVQWLRDELGVINASAETEARAARAAEDSNVVMVPAFTGMGAPQWAPGARAAIFGMTRATGPDELARAALDGVVCQTCDLFDAMARDGVRPAALKIDGGMTANDWFAQRLADMLNLSVDRPKTLETTALGAAHLAGLGAGLYNSLEDIQQNWALEKRFEPAMTDTDRNQNLRRWRACVDAVLAVAAIEAE